MEFVLEHFSIKHEYRGTYALRVGIVVFFTTLRRFVYGTPFTRFIFIVCGYRKQSFDRWKRHRRDSVTFDERIHIEIESLNFYIISVTRQARSFTEGIVRCSFFF